LTNKILIIGGSAGSFRVMMKIMQKLPRDYPHSLIVCLHRLRNARSGFTDTLAIKSSIRIREPFDKEKINSSTVYLAPANYHLLIEYGYNFSLSTIEARNFSRPSIDMTMETAAEVFGERAYGIILSGANEDGAAGMKKIKEHGGTLIVHDPDESEIKVMPESTIKLVQPDHILKEDKLIETICSL